MLVELLSFRLLIFVWRRDRTLLGSLEHGARLDGQCCHVWLLIPLEQLRLSGLLLQEAGPEVRSLRRRLECILTLQCVPGDLTVQAANGLLPVVVRLDVKRLHDHVVEHVAIALQKVSQYLLYLEDCPLDEAKLGIHDAVDVLLTDLELDLRRNLSKHILVQALPIELHILNFHRARIIPQVDEILL